MAEPSSPIPPVPPTALVATPAITSVALVWTGSPTATSYTVLRGTPAGAPPTAVIATNPTVSYTDFTAASGTSYSYAVTASNTFGDSPASATVDVTTFTAAPTGLTATSGNAAVSLAWNASFGAATYNVKRATTAGGPYTTIVATGIAGTAYVDATAANGTTYYYVVVAVNVAGESGNSAPSEATPQAPPLAPTGLSATAGDARVVLSWSLSAGAISYNLKRGTSSGGPYTKFATTGTTSTGYTDMGLGNGTTYYYVVTAENAAGESPPSAQASATPVGPPSGASAPPNPARHPGP